jgi:hypothetical protein
VPLKDDPAPPAPLNQLRDTTLAAVGRAESQREKRLEPLQAAFSRDVDALVTRLTKESKLDEAVAVKKARDAVLAAEPLLDRVGVIRALHGDLISEDQLVARPWKYQTAIYTFHADKTLVTQRGTKGIWSMKDDILRVDLKSIGFWAEISRQYGSTDAGLTLEEVNSSAGKRPNTRLIQPPGP